MNSARRRTAFPLAVALSCLLVFMTASPPALAFQTGPSPDFAGCTIWLNDQGEPLRNKTGREIARQTPCAGRPGHQDIFKVSPGETPGTLILQDHTHHFECVLVLAPGSPNVVVPKICQALAH